MLGKALLCPLTDCSWDTSLWVVSDHVHPHYAGVQSRIYKSLHWGGRFGPRVTSGRDVNIQKYIRKGSLSKMLCQMLGTPHCLLENHWLLLSLQVARVRQVPDFDSRTRVAGHSGRNRPQRGTAFAGHCSPAGWRGPECLDVTQLLFVKEIWCFIREKLCTETRQRFLNGILIKGANNLNARLVAFQGRRHDGDYISVFSFPSALLGSILLSLWENEREAGWWSREGTEKQSKAWKLAALC